MKSVELGSNEKQLHKLACVLKPRHAVYVLLIRFQAIVIQEVMIESEVREYDRLSALFLSHFLLCQCHS